MKYAIFLLFFFAFITKTPGQEHLKDSVTYLPEVILVDPAQNKSATGITPSTVIRGKFFENQSPLDLSSTINQVSGVYILSGALNTNRITIRGVGARTPFGTDKLRLYFNDIPVTNGTGFSTLEAFDLESLNAIEIIKGPKGTSYGANLGGAMLLTLDGSPTTGSRFNNHITTGSYGLLKDNLRFTHSGEHLSLGINYGHTNINGYRENSEFDRDGLLLNTGYRFDERNAVTFLINYIDYTAQIPSSVTKTAFEEDPRQAAFTWKASKGYEANKFTLTGLSYTHRFSTKSENTTTLFYSYLDHYEPRPFNILDEFTNGFGFRSRWKGSFGFAGRDAGYTLGAELYKDEYSWRTIENLYEENNGNGSIGGELLSNNKEYRRQFSGFGTLTFMVSERLTTQLGLNLNKTHYDFHDLFHSGTASRNAKRSFEPVLLPSIGMAYGFENGGSVYANLSRGFSNPSLEETLTPAGVINPGIEQETGMSYEVGSKLFWPELNLWMDLTLYRMDIKNLLVAQRVGQDQFIGKNAGKTRHQGLEFQLDYFLNITNRLRFTPFIGYTLNDHSFVDFVDGGNDYSGNPLTGVPRNRLQGGIRWDYRRGIYWTTSYQYVGAIPLTDANTLSTDAFGVLNSRFGYLYAVSDTFSLGIDLGANNLLNSRYAQSVLINAVGFGGAEPRYYYPGNNRNFYGGLQLNYNF